MSVISIRNLVKTYHVGEVTVRALRGANLDVETGEFVAVTGPSGSGKSTLMHILGCPDRPTSGSYVLDGRDVSRMSKDDLAVIRNRKIGFVFQGFNQRLNVERGITVLLITHEMDIAEYGTRLVRVRDGRIQTDQAITTRRNAATELAALPLPEEDAVVVESAA